MHGECLLKAITAMPDERLSDDGKQPFLAAVRAWFRSSSVAYSSSPSCSRAARAEWRDLPRRADSAYRADCE